MLIIAFNNFEAGQRVLEFGQHDAKMYYKIQKDISKKYSGTVLSVIVTLGPTSYSKGPVPCSEDLAWRVCFIWSYSMDSGMGTT